MRKIFLITIISGFLTTAAYAAPIYGPKLPPKGKIHIGGQTHHVLEKELEGENGEMESLQHFMLLSYGLTDWLSIDLKGGAGSIRQKPDTGDEIAYPAYLAGGYGFRVKCYDKNDWTIVAGFQHISVHPYSIWIGEDKYKSVLDDWQWSALVSYDFKTFTPYVGAVGGRMDYIYWVNDERNRVKNDDDRYLGMALGVNVNLPKNIWINVEGHFFHSEMISGSINWEF